MGNGIKKWITDVLKCIVVIVMAAVAFYVVCPKYYFSDITTTNIERSFAVGAVRCNRITGEIVFVITDRDILTRENKTPQGQLYEGTSWIPDNVQR